MGLSYSDFVMGLSYSNFERVLDYYLVDCKIAALGVAINICCC